MLIVIRELVVYELLGIDKEILEISQSVVSCVNNCYSSLHFFFS